MSTILSGGKITFDFTDETWRTAYPVYYTATDVGVGFYTADTLPCEGANTLRSGVIGNSAASETRLDFTLSMPGALALQYSVSSEANYDKLQIYLDGALVKEVSGTVAWTAYSQDLAAGAHALRLRYAKDGSGARGSDAGAIAALEISGFIPTYYLVRHGGVLYAVDGDALTALEETTPTAALFRASGVQTPPASALLLPLTDPEVLAWCEDETVAPSLQMRVTGAPPDQYLLSTVDISDPSVKGFTKLTADYTGNVLVEVGQGSAEGEAAAEAWSAPQPLADFLLTDLEALWAAVQPAGVLRLRFTLHPGDILSGLVVNFKN